MTQFTGAAHNDKDADQTRKQALMPDDFGVLDAQFIDAAEREHEAFNAWVELAGTSWDEKPTAPGAAFPTIPSHDAMATALAALDRASEARRRAWDALDGNVRGRDARP